MGLTRDFAARMLRLVALLLLAAYPFGVYYLLGRGSARVAGLALLLVLVVRFLLPGSRRTQSLAAFAVAAVAAAAIAASNSELLARLYPVVVNATLLGAFALTLLRPPSMVERIARAGGATLDAAGARYARAVTRVWCGFFVANGALALLTATRASVETWALYNGALAYAAAGFLLGGERVCRAWLMRRARGAAAGDG
ncbi:MAG: hypothetical protein JSR73_14565 [Proteobacteria bacterium]|nr:hypothetical protein [Pseudomonadota bacterium]